MAVNNQQIYLNLQQQASAIALVVDAMNNLNTAAHESAEGISQVKLGTQQLNQAAEQLKTII
jgi:predicted ATP-dependent serine protease